MTRKASAFALLSAAAVALALGPDSTFAAPAPSTDKPCVSTSSGASPSTTTSAGYSGAEQSSTGSPLPTTTAGSGGPSGSYGGGGGSGTTSATTPSSASSTSSAAAACSATAVPLATGSLAPDYFAFAGSSDVSYVATTQPGALYSVGFTAAAAAPLGGFPALVTVVAAPANCSADITATLASFAAIDDVWSKDFLANTLLWAGACGDTWLADAAAGLQGAGYKSVFTLSPSNTYAATGGSYVALAPTTNTTTVRSGPFVYVPTTTAELHLAPVYRVYADPQYAFTSGLFARAPAAADASAQSFAQAALGSPDGEGAAAVGVPVPSRLYFGAATTARPLEGLRVAVKDIYDVAGVKTGCGSRAYYALYPAARESSVVVKRLLAAGAVVVGKTKTSQFANGESPTADWVDQLCPFNPRGEGYQGPSSSSSGSGAAMAAYDWLDSAVGSDTGGSIRGPAGVQGIYGIRPSQDAVSLTGVMPLAASMDTAGYFARTPELFRQIGETFYADSQVVLASASSQDQASTLLLPSDLWSSYYSANGTFTSKTAAGKIFDGFLGSLVKFLGAKVDRTSFATSWTAANVSTASLSSYLNVTYPVIIGKYQYDNLAVPFINDYKNKTGGKTPFIDPVPIVRWGWAVAQGEAVYIDNLARKQAFTDFLSKSIFPASSTQCSQNYLLYPQSAGSTSYRNAYLSTPSIPSGFSSGRIANLGAVPEIVIPIGQVLYNSTISAAEVAALPVTISVLARKGCDLALLKLAEELGKAGIVSKVLTGPTAFAV
ncbi:amidase signature enzyme [Zopfochytrium polystomum]|nr:amidase signature enzyme [Zopfochytrium polystomum]